MMYTIDLLKGRGIPIRNRRGGLLIIAVTIAVPVLIAMTMYTNYLLNKIAINRIEISITDRDTQIKKMADAVKTVESLEKEDATMETCLEDVGDGDRAKCAVVADHSTACQKQCRARLVLNKLDVGLVQQTKQVPDKKDNNEADQCAAESADAEIEFVRVWKIR